MTCPRCSKRHPLTLQDLSTRISATQKLVEEIEGRLAAKNEDTVSELERRGHAIQRETSELTSEELALRIAVLEEELPH